MPQLHANQIQWAAPEPRKVNLEKPDYSPLADALGYLSRVADDISQRKAKMDDDKLKADLNFAEQKANQMIEDSASATADYAELSEKALSEIQAAFNNYDEPTRVRFMRENKDYMDSLQLAISDKIQKKRASQLENDVDINIPMWTTEALNRGKAGLQWMLDEKIAKTLTGISSPEVIAQKQFQARHYYDTASANNGINGSEDVVKETVRKLKNPKEFTSLNAYERSVLYARGKSVLESYEKAKKAGDDPKLKLIEEMYAGYAMAQDGNNMEQLYNDIIGQGTGLIVVGVTKDKEGNVIPQYIDLNEYTPSQRLALATELSKDYDKYNVDFKVRQDLYSNDITKMLVDYRRGKDNKSAVADTALVALAKARQNVTQFAKLDDKTREEVDALLENERQARIEALNSTMYYNDTALWTAKRRENPMRELVNRISEGKQPSRESTVAESALGRSINQGYKEDGGLLQNIIQLYKNDFYKDMGRDTLSEYTLVSAVVLKAFKDAGKLEGTRLAQSDGIYTDALMFSMDDLRQNGLYNARITDENKSATDVLFASIIPGQMTDNEKKIKREIEQWAAVAQSSRDLGSVRAYLSRPEPDTEDVNLKLNGAYLQPAQDMLNVITSMGSKNKAIQNARKGDSDE